ncbi:MAG: hypothetical protein CMN76_17025 [Spirochaetaceae bacterium]|nr:hypothetical protein [Spirochaetaceae bacterium]|tara:strand:+ start:26329 stop:27453 length:1125 start_codon:yes stop_codon:yes gene_type:complete
MYDFIGDIHGHREKLEGLLKGMGYRNSGDGYRHPERKAFFVGDFIDRGPDSRGVVRLVREMIETDAALAVMGNHEWNALQYHTRGPDHQYLRERNEKNRKQHAQTLESYNCSEDEPDPELLTHIEWFYRLPLFYDSPDFRVVHATWNQDRIDQLKAVYPDGRIDLSFVLRAAGYVLDDSETSSDTPFIELTISEVSGKSDPAKFPEFQIAETLLKGQEADLPHRMHFHDKDGHERRKARIKWWKDAYSASKTANAAIGEPKSLSVSVDPPVSTSPGRTTRGPAAVPPTLTASEYLFVPDGSSMPGITRGLLQSFPGYAKEAPPVFFGHYWNRGKAELEAENVCCLDYSAGKGGPLMAYRWDGERALTEKNFFWV